jgi:hypothetical protein
MTTPPRIDVEGLKATRDRYAQIIWDDWVKPFEGEYWPAKAADAILADQAELIAQRAALVAQMERIAKVSRGDELDNITTATNRLNVVIDIARSALTSIQAGGAE